MPVVALMVIVGTWFVLSVAAWAVFVACGFQYETRHRAVPPALTLPERDAMLATSRGQRAYAAARRN